MLSLGPGGGDRTNSEMSVHFNIFYSILILCQTFRGVFKLSVGPAGGRAQFLKCIYNSTFLILYLFLCQTFWGVIFPCACVRSTAPSLGPVEPRGGKGTISKMCVQFKILDSILIFVLNIWGSYRVPARTLDPARTLVPGKTS